MNTYEYQVTEAEAGSRIDKLLASMDSEHSRSQIQSWITDGMVTVNNKKVKTNYKCESGDSIVWEIPEPEPLELEPENIPLSVIYEDSDLLVVNKPKGMVVHPSAGHHTHTLVHGLLYHCDDLSGINGVERPGIVHRIDKDTSGLLVVAKNDRTHEDLSKQLEEKKITRKYEAIVHGEIGHETGIIDAPIGRDPKDRQKMGITSSGKDAITNFTVITHFADYTHIECQLETGRTHQIRVHMQYIDHPIVGDPKYGPRKTIEMDGQALHARILGFTHPRTKEWLEFSIEPPASFQDTLAYIEKKD